MSPTNPKKPPEMMEIPKAKFDAMVNAKAKGLSTDAVNRAKREAALLQSELTGVKAKLQTTEAELAVVKNQVVIMDRNLRLLEGYTNLLGIDPTQAVPSDALPESGKSQGEWERQISEAKTPQERHAVLNQYREYLAQRTPKKK